MLPEPIIAPSSIVELRKYGALLRRIAHDDIETIRQWRNHPSVNQYMVFRGFITPEMQELWFQRINNKNNFFFMMFNEREEQIGMTEIKHVDYVQRQATAGIFIFHKEKTTPLTVFQCYFCLLDFAFDTLQLQRINAGILPDNARAQTFSSRCGFQRTPQQDDGATELWTLTQESYNQATRDLKRLLTRQKP